LLSDGALSDGGVEKARQRHRDGEKELSPSLRKELLMMNRKEHECWRITPALAAALVALFLVVGNAQEAQVSKLGQYKGYTEPIYDQWAE